MRTPIAPVMNRMTATQRRLVRESFELLRDDARPVMLAVEILMKAIEVAWAVLKQQRRRLQLSSLMATVDVLGMFFRILHIDFHYLVPVVRDWLEVGVQCRPKP